VPTAEVRGAACRYPTMFLGPGFFNRCMDRQLERFPGILG
jgi:hypothetical protein